MTTGFFMESFLAISWLWFNVYYLSLGAAAFLLPFGPGGFNSG
jgi:hypothetical protein